MEKWGQDVMTSLHQKLRGDIQSSQETQEAPAVETTAAQTGDTPNADGKEVDMTSNSQEEHKSIEGVEAPGKEQEDESVPEKKSGEDPGETSSGDDPVYLQNFSLDDEAKPDGEAELGDSSLQGKQQEQSSSSTSLLSELGSKLGIQAESVDDFVNAIKEKSQAKKPVIPGVPEEISDMIFDGTIGIEEIASGNLLYNFDELPDTTVYKNHLLGLGFSEEKIEELMDNVSDYEVSVKAREIKNAENSKRKAAIEKLKVSRSESSKIQEQRNAQLRESEAKTFEQYKQSVSKALESNVKLAMTDQELSSNDRIAIQKILTEDGMMRKLIWGKENPTPADLPNAIQSIATLIKRGDISKRLRDEGRNDATKRFIDTASNINVKQGGSYQPVTGGQSGPSWKQGLQNGLKR